MPWSVVVEFIHPADVVIGKANMWQQQTQQDQGTIGAQAAARYGSRGVPSDWYVDPADPDASERHRESVRFAEAEATTFLSAHEALANKPDGDVVAFAPRAPSGPAVPVRQEQSVWLGLPGFGVDDGAGGELGWQADALCAQTDPEAFFPEKGGSTRDAKRVCGACNVRSQCLEYALANDERFGIWGGMSERERRRLRKQAV